MVILTQDSGLAQGVQTAGGALAQGLNQRNETNQLNKLLGSNQPQTKDFQKLYLDIVNNYPGQKEGEPLTPEALNFFSKEMQQMSQPTGEYSMPVLAAIAKKNPQLATLLQQNQLAQQKIDQKASMAKDERAFKVNAPYLEKLQNYRTSIPDQETALLRIGEALESNDLKTIGNFIADRTGNEYFRNAPAAALKSANKEFLLGDIQRISGRPNQFIEQQLDSAYTRAGNDKNANQKIYLAGKTGVEIRKEELRIANELIDKYAETGKEPPFNFQQIVDKKLLPFVEQKQKDLIRDYKAINEGKFNAVNKSFNTLPDPYAYKGKRIQDEETGQVLISNGKSWEPENNGV